MKTSITKAVAIILVCLFSIPAVSQSNKKIGDLASSNKTGGRFDSGGGGSDLWLILEFADLFVDLFILTGGAIGQSQRNILDKESFIPRLTSLEVSGQYGAIPTDYQVFMPRLRAHRGLFSTDLRINHRREVRLGESTPYTSVDWQILMLNLVTDEKVNFRVGTGLMSENADGVQSSFNEHTFALDVYLGRRWRLNGEGRFALDYGTNTIARREWNAHAYYKLFQKNRVGWSAFGGFSHAKYYEVINIWAVSAGLSMTVE